MSIELAEKLQKEKEALTEIVASMDEQLNAYKDLGTVDEIKEALEKSTSLVESLGDTKISDIKSIEEEINKYRALGSVSEVSEAIDSAVTYLGEYSKLGSPAEISEAIDRAMSVISSYKSLGTVAEITECLDVLKKEQISRKCEALAAKYNTDAVTVEKMYQKSDNFEIIETLLSESIGRNRKAPKDDTAPAGRNLNESVVRRLSRSLM